MTHYGIICPGSTGPLNTMLPLGQELQQRGHRVTLCGTLDTQSKVVAAGIEFLAFGEKDFPALLITSMILPPNPQFWGRKIT